MENKEYYIIENRYLAESMAFMGFKYYKFTNYKGQKIYSFQDTEKFRKIMNKLLEMKKEIN